MAENTDKKYVDLNGLTHYDEKIKALINEKDAATLQSSKDYADGLAENYDAAGTAESKVKELADGQVKTNTEAIAKLNGGADTDGSVAKAVADAKTALQTNIDAVDAKAVAAQTDVDALETYVGTIPTAATATDVIGYVNEKTSGIATDASLNELKTRVTTAEGKITTNEGDITALQGRADAVEAKATANAAAITTLNGTGTGSVKKQIDDAFNDFATKVTDDNVVNTYKELIDYCATHSAEAAEMAGDIDKNKTAIDTLSKFVGTLPEGTSAASVIEYINSKVAAEESRATKAEGTLATDIKNLQSAIGEGGSVSDQISAAVKVESDARAAEDAKLDGRLKTVEGKAHTHANVKVLDGITAEKVAGWDDADAKAHTHANQTVLDGITADNVAAWGAAEQNAKTYTDSKIAQFTPIANEDIDKLFAIAQV